MTTPLRIALITGSDREGRRGRAISDWYLKQASSDERFSFDDIDVIDVDLPDRYVIASHPGADALRERLGDADGYVVVTPEYNHSYPASLKAVIDYAKLEWIPKPVAFVSYGGVSGGLRAVEHLRQVFAELHAPTLRETVSFHGPYNPFGEDEPTDATGAQAAVAVQLDDLAWWASTLKAGRG